MSERSWIVWMKKDFGYDKKSGENVDAPEEIHPEQIRRLLEEQPVDKKPVSKICPVGSSCGSLRTGDHRRGDGSYQTFRHKWRKQPE